MARQISGEEWSEFMNTVVKVLEGHPDPNFINTIAYCLSDAVYNKYRGWKTNPLGIYANCAEQTRYVLNMWKSIQTKQDLEFLVQEFDKKLSNETLANELRATVVTYFINRKNSDGK